MPFDAECEVRSLEELLSWEPDCAIVANAAIAHVDALEALPTARVATLVEKPVGAGSDDLLRLQALIDRPLAPVLVGYVLAFHPLVQTMIQLISDGAIGRPLLFRAVAGQHLRLWRAVDDYRQSVSARRDLGGGVVLELSHEIEAALRVMGPTERVEAQGAITGVASDEVEDLANLMIQHPSGGLSALSLNMIETQTRRVWTTVGSAGTVEVDLVTGLLSLSSEDHHEQIPIAPGFSFHDLYRAELLELATLSVMGGSPTVTLEDGINVLATCVQATELIHDQEQS